MASIVTAQTSTQLTNLLETQYAPRLRLQTTELMKIANNVDDATEGVQKIGNALVIRKVLTKNVVKPAATLQLDLGALTFEQDIETSFTVSPTFGYGAVGITEIMIQRLLAQAEYQKAVREQMTRALSQQIDLDMGALMNAAGTNNVGGLAYNFDRAGLLQALGLLRTSAQREFELGVTDAYLVVHPKQYRYFMAINEFVSANIRGDAENPIVKGVTINTLGLNIAFSGNVVDSSSALHNPLHVKASHVLGYNQRPTLLEPQKSGLTTVLIAFAEWGVSEQFDEYFCDVQTSDA